jgi:hypothetical protein
MMTFCERFCARFGVRPERYEKAVLRRCLYPLARVLRPLLALNRRYFEADRDFIRGVGRITRLGQFNYEAGEYMHNPANRGFLRQRLKLRTSVSRLHRLVQAIFEESKTCASPLTADNRPEDDSTGSSKG